MLISVVEYSRNKNHVAVVHMFCNRCKYWLSNFKKQFTYVLYTLFTTYLITYVKNNLVNVIIKIPWFKSFTSLIDFFHSNFCTFYHFHMAIYWLYYQYYAYLFILIVSSIFAIYIYCIISIIFIMLSNFLQTKCKQCLHSLLCF